MPNATSDSASIYLARNALAKGEGERVERGTYVYSPCVEQEGERERERERERESRGVRASAKVRVLHAGRGVFLKLRYRDEKGSKLKCKMKEKKNKNILTEMVYCRLRHAVRFVNFFGVIQFFCKL
jgi:hypothetical protein